MTAKSKAREMPSEMASRLRCLAEVHDSSRLDWEWKRDHYEWRGDKIYAGRSARAHRTAARLLRAEAKRLETATKGRGR